MALSNNHLFTSNLLSSELDIYCDWYKLISASISYVDIQLFTKKNINFLYVNKTQYRENNLKPRSDTKSWLTENWTMTINNQLQHSPLQSFSWYLRLFCVYNTHTIHILLVLIRGEMLAFLAGVSGIWNLDFIFFHQVVFSWPWCSIGKRSNVENIVNQCSFENFYRKQSRKTKVKF